MPLQAFGEREYFDATLGSNISASEHTEPPSATLRQSGILSITTSPPSIIPDVCHCAENPREIPPIVGRVKSGNIFEHNVSRFEFIYYPRHFIEKPGAGAL
jgi:hypothetical protein